MSNRITFKVRGIEFTIDSDDVQVLVDHSWHLHLNKLNNTYYLRGWDKVEKKKIMIHRKIMNAAKGVQIDHINSDTTDNRKINLRECSHSENIQNRKATKYNTSGFKGVFKADKKWKALIGIENERVYLGTFNTPEQAAQAYNTAAIKYHGDFAVLNTVKEVMSDET